MTDKFGNINNNLNSQKRRIMDASKKNREMSEIQKEYAQLCAEAGQLQYNMKVQEFQLSKINERLSQLNQESLDVKKAKEEAPIVEVPKLEGVE